MSVTYINVTVMFFDNLSTHKHKTKPGTYKTKLSKSICNIILLKQSQYDDA